MEIDITQIVVAVIGLLSVIVTSVVVPLIKSKLTNSQWESICNYAASRRRRSSLTHREKEPRSLPGPRTISSSSVRRTASRLTPTPSRSPSRTPGRRWGWIRSSSRQEKMSVKRNRPLCKYIYIF